MHHLAEGGRVLQQAEVAVHRAHVVANVRVHAAQGRLVTQGKQFPLGDQSDQTVTIRAATNYYLYSQSIE